MLTNDVKIVYVCAPFNGDIAVSIQRAREYCMAIINAGCIPYVAYLSLYDVLDDNNPQERETAERIGLAMVKRCNELWVFGNFISESMKKEIETASREQIPVKFYSAKAAIHTVEEWCEEQLSKRRYRKFIQDLIDDGDYKHPTYEQWRQDIEPDIFEEAQELKDKGALK